MSKFGAALLAAALLAATPVSAPAQEQALNQEQQQRELDAHLAFVGELGKAANDQLAAMKKLAEARPLFDSLGTPQGVAANGGKARALLGEVHAALRDVAARLGTIGAPDTSFAPIKPARLLAESREQNAQMIALVSDYDTLIAAAVRGDQATVLKTGPKLLAGSYLYMDAVGTTLRHRQAALPSNRSAHQGLEVGIQLYRGMAAAGRAWYNARLARQPASAEAALRSDLAKVAQAVRVAGREGRANLDREIAELERLAPGAKGEEAAMFQRFKAALVERGKRVALAEEIARWAEQGQATTGAQLAAEPSPALLSKLLPLETQFHALTISEAEAAATKGKAP